MFAFLYDLTVKQMK